jgi:cytochrome c biogenesis protein CcdA
VATGAEEVWTGFEAGSADGSIRERFNSMGLLTVLGAGLIDGLNPCAFATIVFFVSYLSLSGRKGRELLLVGGSFTLGVFLTYLGVGLGLSALAQAVGFMSTFGRWVYALTAIICLVLAGISFSDYLKARRGEAGDMALSLPTFLRKRINAVIRKGQSARAFVLVAFVTGVAISVIEFACTGQVYLPTIVFVLSDPDLQARAMAYLLLYNIFFVLPLIVVFALAYYGTTSEQFGAVLRKHASKVKLATAVLFLALAAWLIYALLT